MVRKRKAPPAGDEAADNEPTAVNETAVPTRLVARARVQQQQQQQEGPHEVAQEVVQNDPQEGGNENNQQQQHHHQQQQQQDQDDGILYAKARANAVIGDTPEEQQFSRFLAGPLFHCTVMARRVLYHNGFRSLQELRNMSHSSIPEVINQMITTGYYVPNLSTCRYEKVYAIGLSLRHSTLFQGLRALAYHSWRIQRTVRYSMVTQQVLTEALNDYLSYEKGATQAKAKDKAEPNKLTNESRFQQHLEQLDHYLRNTRGHFGAPLAYITRPDVHPPPERDDLAPGLPTKNNELIRRTRHDPTATEFVEDNTKVWDVLHNMTVGGPVYVWVDTYRTSRDGRAAYFALKSYFYGTLEEHLMCEKADRILWRSKQENLSLSFDKFLCKIQFAFNIKEKYGSPLTDMMKVQILRQHRFQNDRLQFEISHHFNTDKSLSTNYDEARNYVRRTYTILSRKSL